jgi:hypothetical protein
MEEGMMHRSNPVLKTETLFLYVIPKNMGKIVI